MRRGPMVLAGKTRKRPSRRAETKVRPRGGGGKRDRGEAREPAEATGQLRGAPIGDHRRRDDRGWTLRPVSYLRGEGGPRSDEGEVHLGEGQGEGTPRTGRGMERHGEGPRVVSLRTQNGPPWG